jgi:hypothetical protein
VAAFLAARIAASGESLDVQLVEAAALLHDVDKLLPDDHPLRVLRHGEAGAAWLSEHGHGELAKAVAGHPATLLGDDERYPRWASEATVEERIVAYADKRAMQDLVSLEQRFAAWLERHPERAASLRLARSRAESLETQVCAAAGIAATDVQRLAWVEEALRAALTR